jgi:drug/metabolite transporter (DMT)-like permease
MFLISVPGGLASRRRQLYLLWVKSLSIQKHDTAHATSSAMDWALFLAVALMWSTSFLFIKVAVVEITPLAITAGRLAIGAALLYGFLKVTGGSLPGEPVEWLKFVFIGVFGNILPFFLIGFGEQSVDSGLAAILMGIMPVATILLAHLLIPEEPFSLRRGVGVALGFGGVVVLVGIDALAGFGASTLAQIAIVGGALCYAVTTVFVRRTVHLPGPVMAAGSQIAAAAISVPVCLALDRPWTFEPGTGAVVSVLMLGLFSTALATLFYFRLVRNLGAGRLSQVNYLIPLLGALWGILFLGERPQASAIVALVMVLGGIAIVSRHDQRRPVRSTTLPS